MVVLNMNNRIRDHSTLHDIMHGGRGEITMVSPSGNSHTYRFNRPKNANEFPDDVIFVYAVHEGKQFYIGMIEQDRFRLTRNSRFTEDTDIVKGAKYFMILNSTERLNSSKMTLYHGDRCCKCGRTLSSKFGYIHGCGKSCYRKLRRADVGTA